LGAALVSWHLEVAMYIDAGTFAVSGVLLMLMTKTGATAGPAVSKEQRRGALRAGAQASVAGDPADVFVLVRGGDHFVGADGCGDAAIPQGCGVVRVFPGVRGDRHDAGGG